MDFVEQPQEDGMDRGEIRTEFTRSHADIRAGGKKMCTEHSWKKLSENEVYCTQCPSAWIVNSEVLEELLK